MVRAMSISYEVSARYKSCLSVSVSSSIHLYLSPRPIRARVALYGDRRGCHIREKGHGMNDCETRRGFLQENENAARNNLGRKKSKTRAALYSSS